MKHRSPSVPLAWPPHEKRRQPWQQTHRSGTREDRVFADVEVSIPPRIARQTLALDARLAAAAEDAVLAVRALESEHGSNLAALSTLLLRTESVASSKIESIEASADDYARALHGVRKSAAAVSMVRATEAVDALVTSVDKRGAVELRSILAAHAALMREEHGESAYAGRLRDVQNWIGGSDHSPRGALFVPPPPDTVRDSMDDLMAFANRTDLPAVVQAALAHAQFESIHPFTDGNGRIGRGLINAILRRRRITSRVVVPVASALVARRDRYFDVLTGYRAGDARPLVELFATSMSIAATESCVTASRLAEVPTAWRESTGPVRSDSATSRLLELLPSNPVLSAADAIEWLDAPASRVYAAIDRLVEAGVLRALTERSRDRIWGATSVLDELDDLGMRIARAAR